MANAVTTQAIALGLGASGAMVDVTAYVKGPEGVTYSWGRQSEFRDPVPGQVVFVLENQDGRFTPDNAASPYATKMTEGVAVCWSVTGTTTRLWGGYVTGVSFSSSEEEWGRVTVTVEDIFAIANRTGYGSTSKDLAAAVGFAGATVWIPFTDPVGSATVTDQLTGLVYGPNPSLTMTFGSNPTAPTSDKQCIVSVPAGMTATLTNGSGTFFNQPITATWGLWVTPQTATSKMTLTVNSGGAPNAKLTIIGMSAQVTVTTGGGNLVSPTVAMNGVLGSAHYVAWTFSAVGSAGTLKLMVDGVLVATVTGTVSTGSVAPIATMVFGDGVNAASFGLSHLGRTTGSAALEPYVGVTSFAQRLQAICATVPKLTLGTVDTAVSSALLGQASSSTNAWSSLCDLLRTEQGHIYTTTTGSLLSPTTVVNVRARTRPATVTLTLDAQADIQGIPRFERDVTNLTSTVTATGPAVSATVTDAAAVPRVGSASASETVLLNSYLDLLSWAQDRMIRGENIALRISSVDVDTLTSSVTPDQLLALTPGDRVRIQNIPTAAANALGFSSWDGWFLGASEKHNFEADLFTLYLAPVLPATAVYDTDEYQNSNAGTYGSVSFSTAGVTSGTVALNSSADPLATSGFPYIIQIDQEQMQVTACSAPSGSSQTITVVRGVNGTTAVGHTGGPNAIFIPGPSTYAF